MAAFLQAAREIKESGSFTFVRDALPWTVLFPAPGRLNAGAICSAIFAQKRGLAVNGFVMR